MIPDEFRLTIHMVSSLDGIIARSDNSVGWFDTPDHYEYGQDEQDPESFLKAIDCYVMGSRTYEHAVELSHAYGWPYGDTPTIVMSRRHLPIHQPSVELFSTGVDELVRDHLKPRFRNVWVVGGPELIREFIRLDLVDEIRVSIIPILLGEGRLFFEHLGKELALHLKGIAAYRNGMVELTYEIRPLP